MKLLGAETPTHALLTVWEFNFGLDAHMNGLFPQRCVLKLPKGAGIDSDQLEWSSLACYPQQFWLSIQEESSWCTPKPLCKANQFLLSVGTQEICICFKPLLLLWTTTLM